MTRYRQPLSARGHAQETDDIHNDSDPRGHSEARERVERRRLVPALLRATQIQIQTQR